MARSAEAREATLPWADHRSGDAEAVRDENGRALRQGAHHGQEVPDDPLPCDGCPWASACTAGLACRTFVAWVSTGRVREFGERLPTGDLHRRVFPGQR